MNKKIIKDIGASIRQLLLNFAQNAGRPFSEVMQYYMIERFIYRLSISLYKDKFILKDSEYRDVGAYFNGELAKARTRMQIDIGFGDSVLPHPSKIVYPTLLGMPSPYLLGYTPETLIAEKMHAMERKNQTGMDYGINGYY